MPADIYATYEFGLRRLLERIGRDHTRYNEALVYEQRLKENIAQSRLHGNTETCKAERSQIINQLNALALATLGSPFNELCGLPPAEVSYTTRRLAEEEVAPTRDEPITARLDLHVQVGDAAGRRPVTEQAEPTILRRLIVKHFSDSELRDLCFDLTIDYENLPGPTKNDKARELVTYCERFGRTADLFALCRQQRPQVEWRIVMQPVPAAPPDRVKSPSAPAPNTPRRKTVLPEPARPVAAPQPPILTSGAVGYGPVRQKFDAIASILRDVAILIGERKQGPVRLESGGTIVPGLGLASDAAGLTIRATDVQQGTFKVLVLGEFKHGKSTLLNAMLGSQLLPASATPTTAIITVMVYGESEEVAIYEAGQAQPRRVSRLAFFQEFKLTARDVETIENKQNVDRFRAIEYAQIECRHPFCANGVRLINSPGLAEHTSRSKVTNSYVKQAQAIIFVLDATRVLGESERQFIETVFGPGRLNHVFFVVNRINQVEIEDIYDLKIRVRDLLWSHFLDANGQRDHAFYERRVFFVNARGALDARSRVPENRGLLEDSGLPALEQELERFLTSDERVRVALDAAARSLFQVVAKSREKIAQHKASLNQPVDELRRRLEQADLRFRALEQKADQVEQVIRASGRAIGRKIYADLGAYINLLPERWQQDSARLVRFDEVSMLTLLSSIASDAARKRLEDLIQREVHSYLQSKFTEWFQRIPALIQDDLEKLKAEIRVQVESFQIDLQQIEDMFASGAAADGPGAGDRQPSARVQASVDALFQTAGALFNESDWGSILAQAMNDVLVFSSANIVLGSARAVAFLVAEGISVYLQQRQLRAPLLKALGDRLRENLPRELPSRQDEIYQRVDQQFHQIATQWDAMLREKIGETRVEQQHIIRQKQDASFSVEQETRRLDAIASRLLDLCNSVSAIAYRRQLNPEEIDRMGGYRP